MGKVMVLTFPDTEERIINKILMAEFFTLLYLAEHPGWVFTKEQIYEAVWCELWCGSNECGKSNTEKDWGQVYKDSYWQRIQI